VATKTRAKRKTARAQPESASKKRDHNGSEVVKKSPSDNPEPPEAEMGTAPSAMSTSGTSKQPAISKTNHDLVRMNTELQVRIGELELEMVGGTQPAADAVAVQAEVSERSSSIIAMIEGLHGEIETAYELKEALEADLAAIKNKVSEEEAARAESEARMKLLEAKAALGDQLREDISLVEEERDETARRIKKVTSQLEHVTEERNRLAEQTVSDEARIKHIQADKIALEAKILDIKETVVEMDHLRKELAETREESHRLEAGFKGKLEASAVAKNATELDLTTTREVVRHQNERIEELEDSLATAEADLGDLHGKLDREQVENANLVESNRRAEDETKTLNARLEAMENELDLNKNALRNIHATMARTTRNVRDRYSGGRTSVVAQPETEHRLPLSGAHP
jgi:DNA repair exonuclease SbcCD ATPase subunit